MFIVDDNDVSPILIPHKDVIYHKHVWSCS